MITTSQAPLSFVSARRPNADDNDVNQRPQAIMGGHVTLIGSGAEY